MNTYVYDSTNRLVEVDNGNNGGAEYTYRCNGKSIGQNGCESDRVSQTLDGVTTNYVLDQAAGLTQVLYDGTNTYTYGIGRISQQNGNTPEYFLGDALGSVRQLTDQSGAVILAKSYQPYGAEINSGGSGRSNYGFTGEMTDPSGLTYLRTRYYASDTGRFTSRDTWQGDYNRPLSLNRWNYVEGNPINLTDPSGQCYIDSANMRKWRIWENPIDGPCEDHSGPISPDEPYWHEYRATNMICSAWLSCTREEVVDALSRFAYPGQNPSEPVQPREINFVEPFSWFEGTGIEYLGAIRSIISSDSLKVSNVSEPTHIFHKGQVDRWAYPVGKAWYVDTHGTGNNIYFLMDDLNQVSGAGIFTSLDRKMHFYLETNRIKNWINGIAC